MREFGKRQILCRRSCGCSSTGIWIVLCSYLCFVVYFTQNRTWLGVFTLFTPAQRLFVSPPFPPAKQRDLMRGACVPVARPLRSWEAGCQAAWFHSRSPPSQRSVKFQKGRYPPVEAYPPGRPPAFRGFAQRYIDKVKAPAVFLQRDGSSEVAQYGSNGKI